MWGEIDVFEPREAGIFKMSLIYLDPEHSTGGKTSKDRDSFQGRFVELVPYEKIEEVIEFVSKDPKFAGEMKMIVSLADTEGGTEVTLLFQDIPRAFGTKTTIRAANNPCRNWPRCSNGQSNDHVH